ncbi:class A beta-lactamase [Asticcacaulis sp. AND118]|uniref:class A beta-lactamase n=1 Tax=Asticcacaulis sp. AND118 TaxID=2840468 RepID=UPI001CFFAD10|nr:class A beta-lactamase [Asticcacaulis sp. AND118]UDF04350.1 class A beta-lactamase [Asticcacaulis sp. AND118]
MMLTRRGILAGGAGLCLAGCSEKVNQVLGLGQRLMEIQKRHGGRVGVSVRTGTATVQGDTAADGSLNINSGERFALCSTFKWVLAAAVLKAVDDGRLTIAQEIRYTKADLIDHAPVTEMHVAKGRMTIGDLCSAAVAVSDNTAANLLLPLIGGPPGLTQFVRGLGDGMTRLDRNEPELNTNIEGDERDTTTPDAMSSLLRTVFSGDALRPQSLSLLRDWMVATTTGPDMIPAGVPQGWTVGHKTGRGANGAVNDVAVIWPSDNKPPLFLSIYTTGGTLDDKGRNQVIADITRLVVDALAFAESLDSESA